MFETDKEEEIQEALVEVRKKRMKKKIIAAALALCFLGVIWLTGFFAAKNIADKKIKELEDKIQYMIDNPVVVDPVTPEIVLDILKKETKDISELATAEYVFTNAARFTDTKHIVLLPDSWTQKSFVQKWDGTIKAGIEFDKVTVKVKNNVVTISLPKAKILSYEIDQNSVEILDEKNNIFNPISVNDKANFDKETEKEMKERAIDNGLLKKAQKNAEQTIAAFLSKSVKNFEDYELKFVTIEDKK